MASRSFPPPWSAELQPNYYVVRDADGQQIAYVYYSNDPQRRSAAELLTRDEARRIAANIAKLAGAIAEGIRLNKDSAFEHLSADAVRVEAHIAYSVGKSHRSRSRCPDIVETL
jgi:hypothetical protein